MSEKKANTADGRTRASGLGGLPESAPDGWQQIIAEWKIEALISPLHDKDVDPQNQPKKPHHHVVVLFEGKKSLEQVRELFVQIGGVGCEPVKSARDTPGISATWTTRKRHSTTPRRSWHMVARTITR